MRLLRHFVPRNDYNKAVVSLRAEPSLFFDFFKRPKRNYSYFESPGILRVLYLSNAPGQGREMNASKGVSTLPIGGWCTNCAAFWKKRLT